jgi:hypothetical protein
MNPNQSLSTAGGRELGLAARPPARLAGNQKPGYRKDKNQNKKPLTQISLQNR